MRRLNRIVLVIILCIGLSGCNTDTVENTEIEKTTDPIADSYTVNSVADTSKSEEQESANPGEEDDNSWMVPKASHENFTEQEKRQIQDNIFTVVSVIWDLYGDLTIDDSPFSFSSGIVGFTKEQRKSVADALGEQGVIAVTDGANTQNGELLKDFYNDYQNDVPGMVTVYRVYEDGSIGTFTFLYRNDEIQSYFVGIKPGENREPSVSGKTVQEIAAITYTEKGYFIFEYKNPMMYADAFDYFRVSPMSEECRNLTERFLANLEFQKYKLMVCNWDEDDAAGLLAPGMFEDFYYIKYHEGYRESNRAIPGDLFEEILTTYLPVTVDDLRSAYDYDEEAGTYSQETAFNHQYPPFLEVTDYEYNADGTITLYADAVWLKYNTDCAFTNVIVVNPFDDGTFRILSNRVEDLEGLL